MGVVHLARDPEGRLVAVKVLNPQGTEGANARRRLAREVETMRRVRSPYVAEVLDADVTGEFPYIVTRYVAGPTLEEMVRSHGPLPAPGLRRLGHGMAEALAAIHAAGVVHRDLKPGNVMLADDRPVVIDFGIAQSGDATRLTQTGLVMGTPGYLAPEVIEGQPSSPASDVHCWGTTMAFAATGHLPFGGGSYESIFYRIVSGRADLDGVPAPFVPLISAALARDPGHRPSASWLSAQASALSLSPPGPRPPLTYAGFPETETSFPLAPPPQASQAAPAGAGANPAAAGPAPRRRPRPGAVAGAASGAPAGGQGRRRPAASGQLRPGPAPEIPRDPSRRRPAASRFSLRQARRGPRTRADPRDPPRQPDQRLPGSKPGAQTRPNTLAGLAVMVAAVALTVMLPVAGLVASLAVITLLRAADRAQSTLAVRRSCAGPEPVTCSWWW